MSEKFIKKLGSRFCLMKTTKQLPMGYIGYELTTYEKDDVTIKNEIRAKTIKGILIKINKLKKK